jgi:dihydroorotate dehydrogenase (NAD+) catalytic subunit
MQNARCSLDLHVRLRLVNAPQPARMSQRPAEVDLRVSVGTVHLKNPIIAASGTFGYGIEFSPLVDICRLGALVTKGLSIRPMDGSPAPRIIESSSGLINAIGLQNIGVRAFVTDKLPELRQQKATVVANVFGQTITDYIEVIRVLEDAEGLAAYELNISCPNVERGGMEYSTDPSLTAAVVGASRDAAKRPLWVKLSPNVNAIGLIAKAAESAGADALVIANTYPSLCIDAHNRKSRLGSTTGGLSGPAIKPITMRLVYEAAKVIHIPIVGLGGIESPADVAEYILAGACAVQVGTAHFVDPRASENLVDGLKAWCFENNTPEISALKGGFHVAQPALE